MSYRACIKVPLVLIENIVFLVFPFLRPLVERYIFNPLDFKDDHIKYSQKKFVEFQKRTQKNTDVKGKAILELGPGGSLGFGLLALEAGAKKYLAIDDGTHTFIEKSRVLQYRKLLKNPRDIDHYFIHTKEGFTYNTEVLKYESIDQESRYPMPDDSVDIIYSCAVLEHIHDLDLCFSEMTRVLKEGGIMYHEVDLRDHIFSQESLWFLTISDFWFRTLFSHTGGFVNRKRLSGYQNTAKKYGLSIVSFESIIRYNNTVVPKKLRLLYSEEDIDTLAFYIVLKKNHA